MGFILYVTVRKVFVNYYKQIVLWVAIFCIAWNPILNILVYHSSQNAPNFINFTFWFDIFGFEQLTFTLWENAGLTHSPNASSNLDLKDREYRLKVSYLRLSNGDPSLPEQSNKIAKGGGSDEG